MEGTSIPVRRSRARTQAVVNQIRHQILSGAWGHLLPSERDLAAQFGLARNTVRRILRQLETEGLIENRPGRGSLVRLSPLGDQMSRAEMLPMPPAAEAAAADHADLEEVRTLLEPLVAELAASRASPADMADMESALRNAIAEPGAFEHWHETLRLALWRAARNTALLDWYDTISRSRQQHPMTAASRISWQREWTAIVAALHNRNPDLARELMREHLVRVRDPRPLMPA